MENFKKIFSYLIILSSLASGVSFAEDELSEENFFQKKMNPLQEDCEWRYDGCVSVDKTKLDLRSSAKIMLDNIYRCKNTLSGCSDQEQDRINDMDSQKNGIDDLRERGMTPAQFRKLLHKHDPSKDKKGYFIPLGLNNKELLMVAAATSLGLVLFPSDGATQDFVQDHKSEFTKKLVYPTNAHERMIMGGVTLGSYFVGLVVKDNKLKSAALYVVTSQLATQIVTEGFKRGFGRERPNKNLGPNAWGTKKGKSFVSGHSSGAWSFATVFAEIYKDNKYIPYLAYGMAALTSYGRMHDRKHFLTDVFYGAVIGHLVTKLVLRMHRGDDSEGGLMVIPSYDPNTGTGMVNFEWTPRRKKHPKKFLCEKIPDGPDKISACIYEAYLRSQ